MIVQGIIFQHRGVVVDGFVLVLPRYLFPRVLCGVGGGRASGVVYSGGVWDMVLGALSCGSFGTGGVRARGYWGCGG